jgi:hypothetical protein
VVWSLWGVGGAAAVADSNQTRKSQSNFTTPEPDVPACLGATAPHTQLAHTVTVGMHARAGAWHAGWEHLALVCRIYFVMRRVGPRGLGGSGSVRT